MKKISAIILIALALTIISAFIDESPYPYIVTAIDCSTMNECYGVMMAQGFPLGYLPEASDSGFDDWNDPINSKNFFLNAFFYFSVIYFGIELLRKVKTKLK